jgi:UDP-N-acetylglucosamine 1-carboxyvinyltransferase
MAMAAATGGNVLIKNVIPKHLEAISAKLNEIGAHVIEYDDSVRVMSDGRLKSTHIKTLPYPGFPTDMQPQISTVLSIAQGTSVVTEGVWDNRYKYVNELRKMGAEIQVDGRVAVIDGGRRLTGAPVHACDLRAGAAMVIAGMVASGVTEIDDIHFIERGYERFVEKLNALGADIQVHYDEEESASVRAFSVS